MKTHSVLANFTQIGIENIKEAPARLDQTRTAFESMGAKINDFFLVMGRYDMVLVMEGPGDETAAKLAPAIVSRGAVRSETLTAFPDDEYWKIVAGLA